jgi:hypothetical protein
MLGPKKPSITAPPFIRSGVITSSFRSRGANSSTGARAARTLLRPQVRDARPSTSAAIADLPAAHDGEEQRLAGLGNDFVPMIDAVSTGRADQSVGFPSLHRAVRRVLVRRFPWPFSAPSTATPYASSPGSTRK